MMATEKEATGATVQYKVECNAVNALIQLTKSFGVAEAKTPEIRKNEMQQGFNRKADSRFNNTVEDVTPPIIVKDILNVDPH